MQEPGPGRPRAPGCAPAPAAARGSPGPAGPVRQPRAPAPCLGLEGEGVAPPHRPPATRQLSQGVGWWPGTRRAWGARWGTAGHGAHRLGTARPSAAGCSQGAAELTGKNPSLAQTPIPGEQRLGSPPHIPPASILHPTLRASCTPPCDHPASHPAHPQRCCWALLLPVQCF